MLFAWGWSTHNIFSHQQFTEIESTTTDECICPSTTPPDCQTTTPGLFQTLSYQASKRVFKSLNALSVCLRLIYTQNLYVHPNDLLMACVSNFTMYDNNSRYVIFLPFSWHLEMSVSKMKISFKRFVCLLEADPHTYLSNANLTEIESTTDECICPPTTTTDCPTTTPGMFQTLSYQACL